MSPSATPATQNASRCRQATQREGRCRQVPRPRRQTGPKRACRQVPRLPRRMHVDIAKCHAECQACRRGRPRRQTGPKCAVPPLPRRMQVDVAKCHTCHAECTSMSPCATPATQTAAATTAPNGAQARHQSQPSAVSATPATQSGGGRRQVPRLPRKVKVDVAKRHAWQTAAATTAPNGGQACYQSQPSAISAMPATQSGGRYCQVPRLPRKVSCV